MKKKMAKMNEKIVGLEERIANLEEENRGLKAKLAKKEAYIKELKSSIRRRPLPIELLNELFVSMSLDNAFGLLAKMPNGLLARNIQKTVNGIKETLRNNKLNKEDCGTLLLISEGDLAAMHSGPNEIVNCVRAVLPIPSFSLNCITKATVAFYFEMEILNGNYGTTIGFCDQSFPLEVKWLGCETKSIGICNKEAIMIDENCVIFENDDEYFEEGDIVGLGLVHHPNLKMECFATYNGELLGKAMLSQKFANIELFPAVSLFEAGDSIRVKFGKEEWHFKEFGRVLQ